VVCGPKGKATVTTRQQGKRECSKVIGLSKGLGLGECDREVSESESREREREKMNWEGGRFSPGSHGERERGKHGEKGRNDRGVIATINERERPMRERQRR
jgi:hypothetical protein